MKTGQDKRPAPVHNLMGYRYYGCRCDTCTEANRDRGRLMREHLAALAQWYPDRVPHGTTGGYSNWGCRCDRCRAANTAACVARKRAKRAQQA